jgi:hypothetical protein
MPLAVEAPDVDAGSELHAVFEQACRERRVTSMACPAIIEAVLSGCWSVNSKGSPPEF